MAAARPRPAAPAADAARPEPRPLRAFAWILGATASFIAMAVAGREIQTEMNTFEMMFYRSVVGWAVISAIIAATPGGFAKVATRHPGAHATRNVFHFAGQLCWFYAVTLIPLAQLTALEFTNPIWVVVLAPFLLGEKLTAARATAAGLGFLGVLVVAQPGAAPLGIGQAAALTAALGYALSAIFTRRIVAWDTVWAVIFWMTASQTVMSLVLALPGGLPTPSAATLPWIGLVALSGLTAHYALTSALAAAPANVVAPMEFVRLPLIALVGVWFYGEPLRPAVFLGAALIVAGNLIGMGVLRRRARR
jgi:drug/metabolite transporter (DMT)-like permease